ncbi:6-bladed beta-propeller [Candidatus Palauibacter sp.]|uniref:6-bladed beta-propeller n=1 Tax=Candidatus Palauibacter sp. TaxID=3101350 RepID=UPI003D0ECD30
MNFREIGRIGVLDGDSQMFGAVTALAADEGRGVLFVLDRLRYRVSAFTTAGRFIDWAGGRGEGPGEFTRPVAMVSAGGSVQVVDWGQNRLTRFQFDSNNLAYADELRLPVAGPTRVCLLDDDLIFLRYQEGSGSIIHRVDQAADLTSSFGLPFVAGDDFMAAATDDGLLACDSTYRRVYAASRAVPRVRGYSANGVLLWDLELPGVETAVITREPSGVRWNPPIGRSTNDRPVTLIPTSEGRLLLQVQEGMWGQATDPATVARTFLIDGERGEILDESHVIPRIELFSGNLAFSKVADPVPRILIYEWTGRGTNDTSDP